MDTVCLVADPPITLPSFSTVNSTIPIVAAARPSDADAKAIIGGTFIGVSGLLLVISGFWAMMRRRSKCRRTVIVTPVGKAESLSEV